MVDCIANVLYLFSIEGVSEQRELTDFITDSAIDKVAGKGDVVL